MDEPVDTAAVAAHLKATQGLGSIDIPSAYIPLPRLSPVAAPPQLADDVSDLSQDMGPPSPACRFR